MPTGYYSLAALAPSKHSKLFRDWKVECVEMPLRGDAYKEEVVATPGSWHLRIETRGLHTLKKAKNIEGIRALKGLYSYSPPVPRPAIALLRVVGKADGYYNHRYADTISLSCDWVVTPTNPKLPKSSNKGNKLNRKPHTIEEVRRPLTVCKDTGKSKFDVGLRVYGDRTALAIKTTASMMGAWPADFLLAECACAAKNINKGTCPKVFMCMGVSAYRRKLEVPGLQEVVEYGVKGAKNKKILQFLRDKGGMLEF